MKTHRFGPHTLMWATETLGDPAMKPANDWFEPSWLKGQGLMLGSSDSSGRNPAWFFQSPANSEALVLRHYWRGGLPGKVFKDGYLFTGLEGSRPYRELALMIAMWQQGLPIARPVAARLTRKGLSYNADLITALLPDSRDLVGVLKQSPMSAALWQDVGATIARFHRAGIYHADLNARNILLSQGQFYLIDFDRGEQRTPQSYWQQANLERLRRSFKKEQCRVEGLHYDDGTDWAQLLKGYEQ